MNTMSDAPEKTSNDQSQLSLLALSEYAIAETPELVLTLLGKHGYVAIPPNEDWRQLSGGLEYNHYLVDPITVDAIVSRLLIEITRAQEHHENSWVNGFELQPSPASPNNWLDKMHVLLARDFEPDVSNESGGIAKFTRDATECLLVSSSATQPARLLLHRRVEIDGPS
jgi:hypothetical protein